MDEYDGWLSFDLMDMTDDEVRDVYAFFFDDYAWGSGAEESHKALRVCDAELAFRRFCKDRYYDKDLRNHFRRALSNQRCPLMAFHMVIRKHMATGVYEIQELQVYEA